MQQEQAADEALANTVSLFGSTTTKAKLAEQVQVFLRELAARTSWPMSAAVRSVHGLITKWRKKNGYE